MIWSVQLVFDARDPDEVMLFWGPALGYPADEPPNREGLRAFRKEHPQYDGRGRIDDPTGRRTPVYIQRVPEQKTGTNRVRLEVAVQSSDVASELTSLGAEPSGDGFRDTEGNEFTLVEASGMDVDRVLRTIVIDALDPDRMLRFWSEALGWPVADGRCDPLSGAVRIEDGYIVAAGERIGPVGPRSADPDRRILDLVPGLTFNQTDQPKRTKNRLHIDINSTDVETDLTRLRDLGATVQRWDTDHVLQDPEGNEFCLGGPRRLIGLMA